MYFTSTGGALSWQNTTDRYPVAGHTLIGSGAHVAGLAMMPDGTLLSAITPTCAKPDSENYLPDYLYDVSPRTASIRSVFTRQPPAGSGGGRVVVRPDGRRAAVYAEQADGGYAGRGGRNGPEGGYVVSVATGQVAWTFQLPAYRSVKTSSGATDWFPNGLAWTPDGSALLYVDADGIHRVTPTSNSVSAASPDPDGCTWTDIGSQGSTLAAARTCPVLLRVNKPSGLEFDLISPNGTVQTVIGGFGNQTLQCGLLVPAIGKPALLVDIPNPDFTLYLISKGASPRILNAYGGPGSNRNYGSLSGSLDAFTW